MSQTRNMILFGIFALGIAGADTPVKMADLPDAVQKSIQLQTHGAEIKGFSKETEGGKTFYEAETMVSGHSRDLLFDKAGTLIEVEEETALDALPADVRASITKRAAEAKILRVETVTHGAVVSYEVEIERNGKKSEFTVKPHPPAPPK